MTGITILGATGSIGLNTLDVVRRYPDEFRVVALTANTDVEHMAVLCDRFRPAYAVMADTDAAQRLIGRLRQTAAFDTQVLGGVEGLQCVATLPEVDYVMAAIVGAAGILPTLAAARAGKRVLLANKEALVIGGSLFMREVEHSGAELLPIDSEHNAVFQCMPGGFAQGLDKVGVRRILLTASGGPFLNKSREALHAVAPEQACAHPNWDMGRKISVDSATMMNKGLEVIEACWLFHTTADRVEVVVHPQSVIHSMVEYVDGSVLAQLSNPDMRIPIAHALAWPKRLHAGVPSLDIFSVARLDFEAPDYQRFPCLRLAYEAIRIGGTAPAILNAANEVAVQGFLDRRLMFTEIPGLIESCMAEVPSHEAHDLDTILSDDAQARATTTAQVQRLTSKVVG